MELCKLHETLSFVFVISSLSCGLAVKSNNGFSEHAVEQANGSGLGIEYHHLAKTGGTFVSNLLPRLVGPGAFTQVVEGSVANHQRKFRHVFRIASVRNPCNYYTTLWAWQSAGQDSIHVKDTLRSRQSPPFEMAGEQQKFKQWLKEISNKDYGMMSMRFWGAYACASAEPGQEEHCAEVKDSSFTAAVELPDTFRIRNDLELFDPTKFADCWVKTENVMGSLRTCLERFEQKGGKVNWDEFKQKVNDEVKYKRPMGNSSAMFDTHMANPHARCTYLFDREAEDLVRQKDASIFKAFHFDTCCDAVYF